MLAHLRVGTREEDIHQCCLLSNSNVFTPLICTDASARKKKKKKKRCVESIGSLIYFSSDGELVGLSGCLANPHLHL